MANLVVTITDTTLIITGNLLSDTFGFTSRTYNKQDLFLENNTTDILFAKYGDSQVRLSYNGIANTMQVDSVDGATPSSNADLLSKLTTALVITGGGGGGATANTYYPIGWQ